MRLLWLVPFCWAAALGRQCGPEEFVYEYTQCDRAGQRWRVALPRSRSLLCDNVPAPRPGVNCSFSCPAGHFLHMESQECRRCEAGSYSLGGGVRYEDFQELPEGFSVENFASEENQLLGVFGQPLTQSCPRSAGWGVQSGELRYNPTPCVSRLSISLHLIHDGYVELFYQLPKNRHSLVSELVVRNEQCESYGPSSAFRRRRPADEDISAGNEWHLKRFQLRRGQNLLVWTVASNQELTTLADVIRVPRLDVSGLAFSPHCSPCPAGSFSAAGATQCFGCQAGSFSKHGAASCVLCGVNEYSGPRAASCLPRPNCQTLDFFPSFGKCEQGRVQRRWSQAEPRVCVGGASQKPADESVDCQKCHPGSERGPDGLCAFCGPGQFSDGTRCARCARGTQARYGLFYTNWERMPPFMGSSCEFVVADEVGDCPVSPAWVPRGDRIETATSRAKGLAMELALNVTHGFFDPLRASDAPPGSEDPVAQLSLDLELQCADKSCQFYVVWVDTRGHGGKDSFQFLDAFNGRLKRTVRTYPITRNSPSRLVLAFMRSGASNGLDVVEDKAVLFALRLTNVAAAGNGTSAGGAAECQPCLVPAQAEGSCRPCPPGHFVDQKSNTCQLCPEGTALNRTSSRVGVASCVKCPAHLGTRSRVDCAFDGLLELQLDGRPVHFDFSPLKQTPLTANGIKIFPREGSSYFHSFNVSLFGQAVLCQDSLDDSLLDALYSADSAAPASAEQSVRFCKATAIPQALAKLDNQSAHRVSYASSYIISSKLVQISQNRSFRGFHLSDKQLEYDLSAKSSTKPIDVHFFFEPTRSRSALCPNGTLGVVTTRCEPLAVTNPEVRLSRSCPDGSCDGCLFHVLVESSFACPLCEPRDFEEIVGECAGGRQKIHSIPSKHCVLSGIQKRERVKACSSLTSNVKFLLFLAALLIAFLLVVICMVHRRNKHLEYRYMRIVEGKEPEDVNSCGLESEEEDEEEPAKTKVFFAKKGGADKPEQCKVKLAGRKGQPLLEDVEPADFLSDSDA